MVLLALAAFVVLPILPTALQLLLPIPQTIVLLVTILAVCGVIGWWKGGSRIVAGVWLALAVWMLASPVLGPSGETYSSLVRGWLLLLATAFGVTSLLTPEQPFFSRALAAVGIAIAASFALMLTVPDGMENVRGVTTTEYTQRAEQIIAGFERRVQSPQWREVARRYPSLDSMAAESETQLRSLPERSATMMPALLALESLAALALVWTLYHRVTGTPLGPALGTWRDFRFNDQLIWGLAVGATLFFLPQFGEGKDAGSNLLLFFGALYLLRGVGVLSWVSRGRWAATVLIIATALAPQLIAAVALGVGVGDTWMDWRSRIPTAA